MRSLIKTKSCSFLIGYHFVGDLCYLLHSFLQQLLKLGSLFLVYKLYEAIIHLVLIVFEESLIDA